VIGKSALFTIFQKKAIKMLFMNILMQNLQVIFNGLYFIKLFEKIAASLQTALTLWRKRLQAFATVSLARLAITSLILVTREVTVLWGALLTSSQTLH
jgi:hypothetical protein